MPLNLKVVTAYLLYLIILYGVFPLALSQQEVNAAGLMVQVSSKKSMSDFKFAAVGDFGCTDETNRTISNIISKRPDMFLALGDFSYQSDPYCFLNAIAPLERGNTTVKIVLGDHDLDENLTKYHKYLEHFKMDKPYYSFDYHNVHFLAMATAKLTVIPYDNSSEQYQFVKTDLKEAHSNPDINWIIVFGYRPMYSSETVHPADDDLRNLYQPLFDRYGVDLVLQAHNQNYQRTYPLLYNGDDPIITDKHTRDYSRDPKGELYVTVGTAGRDLYNFTSQAPYVITQFLRHGFLNVDINASGSQLVGTFYENRESSDKDHFTLIKKIS